MTVPDMSDQENKATAVEEPKDEEAIVAEPASEAEAVAGDLSEDEELTAAKNRQGVCGDVNFYYRGEVMGFESWGGESPISEERSRAKRSRGMS